MKSRFLLCALLLAITSGCSTQGDSSPGSLSASAVPIHAPKAEGIAVTKSTPNLLHGMDNDPTPWECEPTLLYAAKYPLAQRDGDFVLDFCSTLSLVKRNQLGSNYIDVSNNVAREIPRTQQKLQRYRDTNRFYIEVTGVNLGLTPTRNQYQLTWTLPKLDLLGVATVDLAHIYAGELKHATATNIPPAQYSSSAVGQDYRKFGLEFFDRKYGKQAAVTLKNTLPIPAVSQMLLQAHDDTTEYALEDLVSNPAMTDAIDHSVYHLLDRTGYLYFTVESDASGVRVTPQYLELQLFRKLARISLAANNYAITCKTSGLLGKSFRCE
jgi:hypothetical protein